MKSRLPAVGHLKGRAPVEDRVARVLIVDDEPFNRQVAQAMLAREGYEISLAESGREALAMIAIDPPDIVLLDIMMPDMDGYAVARQLKADSETLHIPIIMVSALDDQEARMQGLRAGAEDFLCKPIDRAELCVRVANMLKLKAYADFYTRYSQTLETEVSARTTQLKESEAFLGSTMDALPVHICIINPNGDFIAVNELWKEFGRENGIAGDDFISGYNYLDVCDACEADCSDALRAGQGIRSVISGEAQEFLLEYPCHSPTEKRWFTMRATPVDSTTPASVIITHFNITERRNMETEILHKQKLESMGQLAGGVAHDFNNILTVIRSYSDLLLNEPGLAPVHKHDIQEIGRAADRATNLTKQLLAFSRKETVSPRVFDLNAHLLTVQSMLARLIGEDVNLVLTSEPGELHVSIDPTHLEQVVMNLVVNARDAMPTGGVLTIATSLCNLDPDCMELGVDPSPGGYAVLSVTDTGTGMDADTVARVFEPFFTTKESGRGTGLGLSTVFGIVSQAGGTVRISSTVGAGTTFKLYLPVTVAPAAVTPVTGSTAEAASLPISARILFVEDEVALRTLGNRILKKHGFEAVIAADASEALAACANAQTRFDLACIDVVMPQIGGGELAVQLLKLYPDMKIVMMSGFNDDELLRRGIGDKKIPFIQKPYTPAALVAKIREALADSSTQASPYLRLA